MVVDIVYENNTVAMITQEAGIKNMEIEVFNPPNGKSWKFELEAFENVLKFAKSELINSQKEDEA